MSSRSDLLRSILSDRVIVADGAMGTMLQAADPSAEDFEGHEGCNEVLSVTRPDIVRSVHDAYFEAGVDCVETNTFGANLANLAEYGLEHRIEELARAGAAVARAAADAWSTPEQPRFVLGSIGPGTKLPSLGHVAFDDLRRTYRRTATGLIDGGADLLLVETVQDLLQAKAAVLGARDALAAAGEDLPVVVHVTVETTGTMLLGTEIAAALTALRGLRVDGVGLNCATGPEEMREHLRHLAAHADLHLSCMPNAGLPELSAQGARYPLSPTQLADAHEEFVKAFGLCLVGGCCGTTPDHLRKVVERVRGLPVTRREPHPEPGVASLYQHVPFRQDSSFLSIGERTNANGSKAFREAMLQERWDDCTAIARNQTRDGAHLLDVCVDYVGRDGVADVAQVVGRLATESTLPLVLDSTEPAVLQAGLELTGGRPVINSVNFEDGDGPDSRFARIMPLVAEHGAAVVALTIDERGQARTAEHKVEVADRLISTLTGQWGMREEDILVDCLTFPIATGQEETRRDGLATLEAITEVKRRHPAVQTTLGVSNISFGLSPAARIVLNSVFLHEAVAAGLDSAIVHAARIVPVASIPPEQRQAAEDLVYDRRRWDADGTLVHDPLERLLEVFQGVDAASKTAGRAAELAALPLEARLSRRIVDGDPTGMTEDLDAAMAGGADPLDIINDHLLAGMRTVGELFGSGQMQLPFVLRSAEVMKGAVAHLEPHIEQGQATGTKGTMVLATVKGDVHDIGKNLVDIILSNNGYTVVNLGIKQPVSAILQAAQEHDADVIGMSGLLVKSTIVMKENLEEINARGADAVRPVILGGAALTRSYVEHDLSEVYDGEVLYAKDAFEGLRLMEKITASQRGEPVPADPPRQRRAKPVRTNRSAPAGSDGGREERSDVERGIDVPVPPFWGTRVVKGIAMAEYREYLDERATFRGQWGLKPSTAPDGPGYDELVEKEGRPRLRLWLERMQTEGLAQAAVVYGYFPCVSRGRELIVLHHEQDGTGKPAGSERFRWEFPRQVAGRHLCLADFFRSQEEAERLGGPDVLGMQLVTMGPAVSVATQELFAKNAYRDYLELHGLSVQLTEALAEYWHARVRAELGTAGQDDPELSGVLRGRYRGQRFSFGYPACPDLEMRRPLVEALGSERIGVSLAQECQLHPEQSTDAIVVHHPQATYFSA